MITLPPLWLLDVDGVINASKPGWGGAPHKRGVWSTVDRYEYTLRWAPALITRIRDLHKTGTVEIVWCTTWCAEADTLERLWALPTLGRAFTQPLRDTAASAAKLAAARKVLADGRRLIWTDDIEVPHSGPLHDELTAGGRGLLIRPKPSRGLQRSDLNNIEIFALEDR